MLLIGLLRERPQTVSMVMGEEGKEEGEGGTLLGLPELDTEVDVSERGTKLMWGAAAFAQYLYLSFFHLHACTHTPSSPLPPSPSPSLPSSLPPSLPLSLSGSHAVQHGSQQTDLYGGDIGQ